MATPSPYFHLKQGQGGVFELNFQAVGTTSIGTAYCRTCVCVYIPLSATACFAAHIDSHVPSEDPDDEETGWLPTLSSGEALKVFTLQQLKSTLSGYTITDAHRAKAVVICPFRSLVQHASWKTATGSYVVRAINDFFELKGQGSDNVTTFAHGFVVNHKTGVRSFLTYHSANETTMRRHEEMHEEWQNVSTADLSDDTRRELSHLNVNCREKEPAEYGFHGQEVYRDRQWTFKLDYKEPGWRVAR